MTQPTPELTEERNEARLRSYQAHQAIDAAMAALRKELDAAEDECTRLEREIGL